MQSNCIQDVLIQPKQLMTFGDLFNIAIIKTKKLSKKSKKSNHQNMVQIILHNQIVKKINIFNDSTPFSVKMIEIDEKFINHHSSKNVGDTEDMNDYPKTKVACIV